LRRHGAYLFNNGGMLRVFVAIKIYGERTDGNRVALVVMYRKDAADNVVFQTAMSIGTVAADDAVLDAWRGEVPNALPPILG
jgi:hypothetical protein